MNVHLLAILVSALGRYHHEFAVAVCDNVLEQIVLGLEQNNFKHNQRRIAQVKYLGELYNYKLIDSNVIFESLYRLTSFGHENGTPKPGRYCGLDMPDDFFRIRLVCTLLDVCGMCFERGTAKKKLDFFLTFFQYYIFTKETLPMDVEFMVQDTFQATRPNWKLHTNLEEAAKAFEEAVAKTYKSLADEKTPTEPDDEDSSSDGEGEAEAEAEAEAADDEDAQLSDDEAETASQYIPPPQISSDSEEEEDIVVQVRQEERDPELDAEFDRELAKMLAESLGGGKFERKPVFDVPLPMRRAKGEQAAVGGEVMEVGGRDADGADAGGAGKMAFSLLTKRGGRMQVCATGARGGGDRLLIGCLC